MRKLLCALLALAAATVVLAGGASAVTNGRQDGDMHPYVGLMVAQDADGVPLWRCSGSLLSPTVFLTAGHCTEAPAAHIEIWFDEGPIPYDPEYAATQDASPTGVVSCNDSAAFDEYPCVGDVGGTPHPNPDFCTGCGNGLPGFARRDVGVVTLDAAVPTTLVSRYAELAGAAPGRLAAARDAGRRRGLRRPGPVADPRQPVAKAAALLQVGGSAAEAVGTDGARLEELHAQQRVPAPGDERERWLGRHLLR
jgi:hypothetical protein